MILIVGNEAFLYASLNRCGVQAIKIPQLEEKFAALDKRQTDLRAAEMAKPPVQFKYASPNPSTLYTNPGPRPPPSPRCGIPIHA